MEERILEKWKLTSQNQAEIASQIKYFEIEKSHYSVRGKWSLCFMAEVGEYMRLNSKTFAPSLGRTGKVSPTCSVPVSYTHLQFDLGYGDYTEEKYERPDISLDEIDAILKR